MANPKPQIHLPDPSIWPITLAFGLLLIALGIIFSRYISLVGIVILLAAIAGWVQENRSEVHHG